MGKIVKDIVEHTKTQHEITKARHKVSKKSPSQAKAEFLERHEHARLSPAQKQQIELQKLQG